MYKRYIKCGMSRKSYSLGKGRCLKVPIEGREAAAIEQNRNEAACIRRAEELKLECFPKIFSCNDSCDKLILEEVRPLSDDGLLEAYLDEKFRQLGVFNNCREKATNLAYVFFGLDQLLRQHSVMNGPDKFNEAGFREFCAECIKNAASEQRCLTAFYGLPILRSAIAQLVQPLLDEKSKMYKVFGDLIRFALDDDRRLVLADLWNKDQWGIAERDELQLVVLDAGFSRSLQYSEHYISLKRTPLDQCQLTYPKQNTGTFNGKKLIEIHDPTGKDISYKFFTSKNTEYILSSSGMSRRIKKACLPDDGLYGWTDKMIFTDYNHLRDVMSAINANTEKHEPTQIAFKKNKMCVNSINSAGRWTTTYALSDFSTVPEIGKHVLEFKFDGDQGVISKWHPGHAVSYIEPSLQKD